jgi:hypothetical protein
VEYLCEKGVNISIRDNKAKVPYIINLYHIESSRSNNKWTNKIIFNLKRKIIRGLISLIEIEK